MNTGWHWQASVRQAGQPRNRFSAAASMRRFHRGFGRTELFRCCSAADFAGPFLKSLATLLEHACADFLDFLDKLLQRSAWFRFGHDLAPLMLNLIDGRRIQLSCHTADWAVEPPIFYPKRAIDSHSSAQKESFLPRTN
jgi:hypothetical protein